MIIPCNDAIKSQVKKDLKYFLTPTYNGPVDISFEEAQKVIKTAEDVCYIMTNRGYNYEYICNYNIVKNNINWVWGMPAKLVFENNSGGCGSTANLVNGLLSDKFEDSGYMSVISNDGGHTINWFLLNGLYYYFDFAGINPIYYDGHSNYYQTNFKMRDNPMYYLWYVTDKPFEFYKFFEKYCYHFNFVEEVDYEFVYIVYQCRAIRRNLYPIGFYKDKNIIKNFWHTPLPQVFSKEIEDNVIFFRNYLNTPVHFEETPDYEKYIDVKVSKDDKSISLGEED